MTTLMRALAAATLTLSLATVVALPIGASGSTMSLAGKRDVWCC